MAFRVQALDITKFKLTIFWMLKNINIRPKLNLKISWLSKYTKSCLFSRIKLATVSQSLQKIRYGAHYQPNLTDGKLQIFPGFKMLPKSCSWQKRALECESSEIVPNFNWFYCTCLFHTVLFRPVVEGSFKSLTSAQIIKCTQRNLSIFYVII